MEIGVIKATCVMCGWTGRASELLILVSEGLTLEDSMDRFTTDLLHLLNHHLELPLGEFLVRWNIVTPECKERVLKFLIGRSIQGFIEEVMRYLIYVSEQAAKEKKS